MECPVCRCQIDEEKAICCTSCNVAFHHDCWDYVGQCSTFGCGSKRTAPFQASADRAVISIDENTRPPFRLATYVEGVGRKLPFFGRAYLLPSFIALAGTVASTWSIAYLAEFVYFALPLSAIMASFVATLLSQKVKEQPWSYTIGFWISTLLLRQSMAYFGLAATSSLVGSLFLIVLVLMQQSLFFVSCTFSAQALLPHSIEGKHWLLRPLLASLLAYVAVLIIVVLSTNFTLFTPFSYLAFVAALFTGLSVALPLEVAQSALSYRLDQEGKRQAALLGERENRKD